ncbi:basement membrane-specific heparan sulfate proteoglycan core protein-like [Scomber scombrus]|uniref:basement membrane-specific heparan sulfate proteoglycan core protein-like n=1 Tax=Scomber scombrus TaxID=13677 RepID=UPI002DD890D7|nr:basement membrane-specific heparan sulfate proteoglycan core protein-like [Scomber scombrus]
MTADETIIPVGGSVTLTCSVDSSADWKYYWFREYSALQSITNVKPVNKVSEGGIYHCRAGRGDPEIFTEFSRAVTVRKTVPNKAAVVTLQPNWTEIYSGETIMLRCEIHDGDTEWEYEWKSPRYTSPNNSEYMISDASSYHSGNYRCRGRKKNAERISTEWSADIKLTVSDNPPAAVLTVSPSWLSPGDSVTLSCEVEHPSAGWRFYWYKTVPKLSYYSYIYELLPGSINGTEQDSYIIHGPTHTAGYMCRAGRGDPVYYTQYSKPGFVWSGDVHSAVTLKVSPDRVQHFTSDSVSLSCEGNFTEWRVRRFPEDRYTSDCYNWRSMTGSTCNIYSSQQSDAVYWCESGSGEFSNAVNITIQKADIILVSPVHPVTEGQSVTLGCKLKREELLSVSFYQNDKLIQSDTRRELNISAVSKSDEGFYKCKYSGEESAQSWMSVHDDPKILTLSGWPIQSESTNQDSATHHMVNLNETQDHIYNSLLHGDVCVYESIRGSEDPENDDYVNSGAQSQNSNSEMDQSATVMKDFYVRPE